MCTHFVTQYGATAVQHEYLDLRCVHVPTTTRPPYSVRTVKSLSAKIGCPQRLAAFSSTSCTWKEPASSGSVDRIWSKYSLSAPRDFIVDASSRLSRLRAADSNLKKYCLLLFSSALDCPCFCLTEESAWRCECEGRCEGGPKPRDTPQRDDATSEKTCPRGLHDPMKAFKLVILMLIQGPFAVSSSPALVAPDRVLPREKVVNTHTQRGHTACRGRTARNPQHNITNLGGTAAP